MIVAIIISTCFSIAVSQESQSCKVCNCQFSNVQVLDQLIEEKVNAALTESVSALSGGGATYVRWGKSRCPSINGTELVYVGRAGGTYYNRQGGGANKICLPEDPDYLPNTAGYSGSTSVWGSEYEFGGGPHSNIYQHNVPCAVCHVSTRSSVLMIPAKTECPTSWTREYYGYLTAEAEYNNHYRSLFECIDNNPDVIPNSSTNIDGALFCYAGASCNAGLDCPPYENSRILSCTVCTK